MSLTPRVAKEDDLRALEIKVELQAKEIADLKECIQQLNKIHKRTIISEILERYSLSQNIKRSINIDDLDNLSIDELESKLLEINDYLKAHKIGVSKGR